MPISFNDVPANIRVPGAYIEIDNTRANRGLAQLPTRILVLGQRLSTGTVAQAVPTLVTGVDQGKTYFGRGSMLAAMIEAIKLNNKYTELWAIALSDNGAGVAATGTIVASGTATAAGTINLYIAGQRVQVAVASGDTANTIAAAINTAIGAAGDLPVTSSVNTATVTITARHKGINGNGIDIRENYYGAAGGEKTPAGITLTITAMASGASNPDIATAIAAMPDEIFDFIITPWTDATNLNKLDTELNDRWGPPRMKEGHAFSAYRGTVGDLSTFGNGRNNPHISFMGFYDSPTPDYVWGAAYGAVAGYYSTIDPARPLQTLELKGVLAPPLLNQFDYSERNILLYDGIATFTVARDGRVQIERAVTSYQTNPAGAVDPSYLDSETLLTLSYLRQTLRARILQRFPRFKLANDGVRVGAGQAVVTPRIVRAEIIALFGEWEAVGLVENVDQFKQDLVVERDANDPNRLNALLPPDLINQLRVIAAQIQFLL